MSVLIKDELINIQSKTTLVLVGQQVILSEQEQINGFLDKINEIKSCLESLRPEYSHLIESALTFVRMNENTKAYIMIREGLLSVETLTERLIQALSNKRYKECYNAELEIYNILKSDLMEVIQDLEYKIAGDSEMTTLLNSLSF